MKTIVYVDGYNFYYGLLNNNHGLKWLDLYKLFKEKILKPQNPEFELLCVKFYTADIQTRFASRGAVTQQAQQAYHRALTSPHTGSVEIIKGTYTVSADTPLRYNEPPDKNDRVKTWKMEEKQTDVNIALDMFIDATQGHCEQVVLCSNDTDITPALHKIHQYSPSTQIGVVFPINQDNRRPPSKEAQDISDWTRRYIRWDELAECQFPDRVPTKKRPAKRPTHW